MEWTLHYKTRGKRCYRAKRTSKEIGSSLEAEIKIFTNNENFKLLEGIDLAEYFITSRPEKFVDDKIKTLKIEVKSRGQ